MPKVINGETGREYDREEERNEFQMRLDFIKDDMGYETQEEFNKDYIATSYPVSLADVEGLKMLVQKELVWIWKHHKKEKTHPTLSHVESSMLETICRFEEAIRERRTARYENDRKSKNGK